MKTPGYSFTKNVCYLGYVIQAVVNNLLSLLFVIFNAAPYNISVERLGRLLLINFTAQLVIDLLSVYLVPIFGEKNCIVFAQLCSAVGFVLLTVLPVIMPPYAGIIISVIFMSVGSGFIEVLLSPVVEALPTDDKAGNMSLLHSFYSWGQVITVCVTTALLAVFGRGNWFYIPLVWSVFPFLNTFLFLKAPIPVLGSENSAANIKGLFKHSKFYRYLLFMLCAGASEIAMAQWASFFVEESFALPKWLGDLLGPCAFALLMGTGRLLFGIMGHRFSLKRLLMFASMLCVLCYLFVAFSKNGVLGIIGCALCGFSVSVMWPGVYSLCAGDYPKAGPAMFSFLALLGDIGCSLGSWLVGFFAELAEKNGIGNKYAALFGLNGGQPSMQFAFLILAVFPALMLLFSLTKQRN